MNSRIMDGDILTFAAIVALSLWDVFSDALEGWTKYLYLITYLAFFLFVVIKSLLRRKLLTLKDRFVLLLVTAWAALASFSQVSINFWNEKLLLRPLILSASWFVLAGYQFFIFSSKDLRETQ